jgi:deazaflavin-dependent oxidoreductase (nitroreductase family)
VFCKRRLPANFRLRPKSCGGNMSRRANNRLIDRNTTTTSSLCKRQIGLLLKLELADPPLDGMLPAALKEGTMSEAKLAPNLPDWMVEHANRYLASGGTDGHMYKITVRGEITAPALLLTTTGRKSGDKFIFPLFYGSDGGSYFVVASKGGAPQHPGWYRNILANPDVEVQVGTKKMNARARTTAGEERLRLWKKALEFWPPYADYQLKTEREIPVVVLDPVH